MRGRLTSLLRRSHARIMTYIPKEQIPIAVTYKKPNGRKVWLKVFTDLRYVDPILAERSKKIPAGMEILDVGVGKAFIDIYKKKYKIK